MTIQSTLLSSGAHLAQRRRSNSRSCGVPFLTCRQRQRGVDKRDDFSRKIWRAPIALADDQVRAPSTMSSDTGIEGGLASFICHRVFGATGPDRSDAGATGSVL